MLKHHIVADGANPITEHFHLVRQVATAGQQHVWKIYDAKRIKDGKVWTFCRNRFPSLLHIMLKIGLVKLEFHGSSFFVAYP